MQPSPRLHRAQVVDGARIHQHLGILERRNFRWQCECVGASFCVETMDNTDRVDLGQGSLLLGQELRERRAVPARVGAVSYSLQCLDHVDLESGLL